jgi:hypothetical protein
MAALGEAQFTAEQYAEFADEIARRGVAYARAMKRRDAEVLAHAAAQTIRNLAPGGKAERSVQQGRWVGEG